MLTSEGSSVTTPYYVVIWSSGHLVKFKTHYFTISPPDYLKTERKYTGLPFYYANIKTIFFYWRFPLYLLIFYLYLNYVTQALLVHFSQQKLNAMNARLESSNTPSHPRVALRPTVPTEKAALSPAEQFQNDTLRPIIKMQNDLILSIYKHFLRKRKVRFEGMSIEGRRQWIEKSVSKDNRLRGILLGMVIGQFTEEELSRFIAMESEIRRRITNLIAQRLQSQMKDLL